MTHLAHGLGGLPTARTTGFPGTVGARRGRWET